MVQYVIIIPVLNAIWTTVNENCYIILKGEKGEPGVIREILGSNLTKQVSIFVVVPPPPPPPATAAAAAAAASSSSSSSSSSCGAMQYRVQYKCQ